VKTSAIAIGLFICACRLGAVGAAAEDEGVTVIGSGEARARPNAFEFFTRVSGSSELGGDALVKFREFKRRTTAAVEKLKLPDSDVAVGGFSLTSADAARYGQIQVFRIGDDGEEETLKPGIMFSSLVRVCVRGIDRLPEEQVPEKISELFDRLKDGGVSIQPVQANTDTAEFEVQDGFVAAPVVVFVLEDATELRRLARQRAFQAARTSAEELAKLAGVELGAVVSIQEVSGEGDPWMEIVAPDAFEPPQIARRGKLRLTSGTMSEIPVRARLRVRFGLKAESVAGEENAAAERNIVAEQGASQ